MGYINLDSIVSKLQEKLGRIKSWEIRKEFLVYYLENQKAEQREKEKDALARRLVQCRVVSLDTLDSENIPLPPEIDFERSFLDLPHSKPIGIIYNGFKLQELCLYLISEEERKISDLHLILTPQLLVTYGFEDRRYHLRAAILGYPSLISISGIIEAPAKPREFYLKIALGMNKIEAKAKFKGRFVDYDNPNLSKFIEGYIYQSLFYFLWGEGFCDNRDCRLYNAHWQEDLIFSQLGGTYEFCPMHYHLLETLN